MIPLDILQQHVLHLSPFQECEEDKKWIVEENEYHTDKMRIEGVDASSRGQVKWLLSSSIYIFLMLTISLFK